LPYYDCTWVHTYIHLLILGVPRGSFVQRFELGREIEFRNV
jgi:hypothetical protein